MTAVTVLASLRAELTASRAAGDAFEAAWPAALAVAVPRRGALATFDRENWLVALHGTRDAWQAAYDRSRPPVRLERAIAAVALDPDREPIAA